MHGDPIHSNDRGQHPGSRLRRAAGTAGVVIAAGVLVAACGSSSSGPRVASAGASADAAKSSSGGSSKPSPLAYSRCMRAHGIKDFPDPNSSGGIAIQGHPGDDLDPNGARFQAADQACKSLLPAPPTSGSGKAQAAAEMLRYARCMRAHGIADFPDLNGQGELALSARPGGDLAPNNPQFQSADKACKSLLPGGGAGIKTQSSSRNPQSAPQSGVKTGSGSRNAQ
jgi:hypothetical protein